MVSAEGLDATAHIARASQIARKRQGAAMTFAFQKRRHLLFLAAIALSAPARAEWVDWKAVEGWKISRDTENPRCSMGSLYEGYGSTFLYLAYTPAKDEAYVSISNENWQSIVDGESMALDFHLGTETWSGVKAKGYNGGDGEPAGFVATFDGKDFLIDFGIAPSLIIMKGSTVVDRLSLKGTKAAVIELSRCASSINKGILKDPFAN
jgi:hypothetical protein